MVLAPEGAARVTLALSDGLLVPTPSLALGSRGCQHKRGFLGFSALLFLQSDFQALLPNKPTNNERPQSHFERIPVASSS